ncbi:hypothetical protein ACKKBG_A10695 [Auxenochlorella protothecoides x Auxenochlorella symbiontica]
MVTVLQPGGPWNQLASASFLLSALVSDLLILRLFLFAAYIFLFAAALTGYPRFPRWGWQDAISVDGLAWSSTIIVFHGYAVWRHLWDERPIRFRSEDEEQLWRLFHRRSGMYRLEMSECLRYGRWARYAAGDVIVTPGASHLRLHLVVEGLVELEVDHGAGKERVLNTLHSGTIFDFGVANVFGVYIGFECAQDVGFTARAKTDCLLYEWSIDDLEVFASRLSPSVPAFWRSFVLCEVGLEYAGRVHPARGTRSANGEWEGPEYEAGARSRDFTEPLRPEELPPRRGLWGTLRAVLRVFDPLPPAGLRHCSTPMSGVMARNRLAAVAAAKGLEQRATLQQEERAQDDVEAAKAVAGVK